MEDGGRASRRSTTVAVRNLIDFYEACEIAGFDRFLHVQAWLDRGLARPPVQRGLQVTAA